tara:strand:- start:144 stop:1052 length:909 start_codon:yes stop_codon:yes gene_type:complete
MKKAISILGPTHSGKTDLAINLNKSILSEIISVDSVQIYKQANIGSNKPKKGILKKVKHGLINILDIEEEFSVNHFLESVSKELASTDNTPLFVGGSMMYFYSLFNGISELPRTDKNLRKELQREGERIGWEQMHKKLKKIDPKTAHEIKLNDSQRIQRALEINMLSTILFSDLKKTKNKSLLEDYKKFTFAVIPRCRKSFKRELKDRFANMLEEGLIKETESILKRGGIKKIKVLKTVGYKQAVDFISKKVSYDEMIELATNATYQLAKRQMTWLKKFNIDQTFFSDEDDKVMKILSKIQN